MLKKLLRKSLSFILSFNLLLQSFLPILALPAYAAPENSFSYNQTSHEFKLENNSADNVEFFVYYKPNDKAVQALQNTVSPGESKNVLAGSCSTGACIYDTFGSVILKTKVGSTITSEKFVLTSSFVSVSTETTDNLALSESESNWLINPETDFVYYKNVSLGDKYSYKDTNLSLVFTKLPENPGDLTIKEVKLTPEQQDQTGSLTDTAYDITSSMVDGSFAYDLTLPLPESAKDKNISVISAETESALNSALEVTETTQQTTDSVIVKSLNHFTIFIIVDGSVGTTTEDPSASSGSWYLRHVGNSPPAGYSHAYQWATPKYSCDPNALR